MNETKIEDVVSTPPDGAAVKPKRTRKSAAAIMKDQGDKPVKAAKKPAKKAAKAAKKPAKKAVKAAKAVKKPDGEDTRLVKADMTKYVTHQERTDGGRRRIDVNDDVAEDLRTKTLDQIYKTASGVLEIPQTQLKAKYGHLNIGMQRMNLGNRIRAAYRAQEKTASE